MKSYKKLVDKFQDVFYFDKALGLLKWDTETYMPHRAFEQRSSTVATLEKYQQEILSSHENLDLLNQAYQENLNELERANLDLMKREIELAILIPQELNEKLVKSYAVTERVWLEARESNDSSKLEIQFQSLIELIKEKASLLADYYSCDIYTALVKEYDSEITQENLNASFEALSNKEYRASEAIESSVDFFMALSDQEVLIKKVISDLGFDPEIMNLSTTVHPFCDGSHDDVRLAITYKESDWTNSLLAAIHEMGHALYDAGLSQEHKGLVIGRDAGMTVHESQGLLFEMFIAKSQAFSEYLAKLISELGLDAKFSSVVIYSKLNKANSSLIRIDATKDSYEQHLLLRYEIEKRLIDGSMKVNEIENYWNEFCYSRFLNKPSSLKEGWLQDIHWFLGYIGYFPCYYLGLDMAESLWQELQSLKVEEEITEGNFSSVAKFLSEKIYLKKLVIMK